MSESTNPNAGQVLVFTGDGKGKTTAALGTVLRAAGHGMRVAVVQFIKGTWRSGEEDALARLPLVELHRCGAGFVGIGGDDKPEEVHRRAAQEGLDLARRKVLSGRYRVVVLDEVNNAMHMRLLALEAVLQLVADRPPEVDLILTGRDAPEELLRVADLVTEMRAVKHPFQRGITARKGLDY